MVQIPVSEPGTHDILVHANLAVHSNISNAVVALPRSSFSQKITIRDKSVGDSVKAVWSADLADRINDAVTTKIWLNTYGARRSLEMEVSVDSLSTFLGCRVWWRPSGQGCFHPCMPFAISTEPETECVSWQCGFWRTIPIGDSASEISHVDLRFVPDAGVAFDGELTEYFSGIIEWDRLPVGKGEQKPTGVFRVDLSDPKAAKAATQPAATP
jgi:hypothetical protein